MRTRVRVVPFVLLAVALAVFASPALAQSTGLAGKGLSFVKSESVAISTDRTAFARAVTSTETFKGANFLPWDMQTQTVQKRHEGFGVVLLVGPFYDKFSLEDTDFKINGKTGLYFALALGGNRPGKFGVETDLGYFRRRCCEGDDDEDVQTTNTFQVPLLFRGNFGAENLDGAIGYVKFGPAMNIVMSTGGTLDIEDIERFQVDIIVAGGFEWTRLVFEVRYDMGIRQINKDFDEVGKIKSRTLMILFGFRVN